MPLPALRTDYGPDPNMLMMLMKQQRENQLMAREEEQKRQMGNALAQAMSDDPQVAAIAQANPDAVIPYLKVRESQAMHQNALREADQKEYDTAMGEVANVANYLLQLPQEQRQPIYRQQMGQLAQKYPRVAQKVGRMFPQEADEGFLRYLVASQTPVKDQMGMNKVGYQTIETGRNKETWETDAYGRRTNLVASSPMDAPDKPTLKPIVNPDGTQGYAYFTPESGGKQVPGFRAPEQKGTTVNNIMDKGNLEEQKAYGKYLVDDEYKPIASRASTASDLLAQLNIAKNIDVQTGALQPLKEKIAKYAQAVNVDPETFGLQKADNAQALTGVMQNIVLHKMQAQKGPQTENDAKRIESTVANLGNTPEAFRFLMDTAIATEERAIEQRNFYDQYMEKKNTFRGAAKAWEKYKSDAPLVGKNPTTGKPILYNQFKAVIMQNNPNLSEQDIAKYWRENYVK